MQMMLCMNLMEKNFAVKGSENQFLSTSPRITEQTVGSVG